MENVLSLSHLYKIVKDQLDLSKEFVRSPPLMLPGITMVTIHNYPVLTVWFAFFGGSLHSPVTTFFYLQLEASDTDIGVISTYMDIGSLVAVCNEAK